MVERVALTNFRSYAERNIDLHPGATIIVGPNATGKTNLLEALYVLANTKSFRAKDHDLVRHEASFFRIAATVDRREVAFGYRAEDGKTQKKVTHDTVVQPLAKHLGFLRIVLFEPNDSLLVYGSPDRRRRYLDYCIAQTDPAYNQTMVRFRRVLAQRNRLLAEWSGDETELFAWNIKLTELAAEIYRRRTELIARLNLRLSDVYAGIAGHAEELRLRYVPTVSGENYAQAFQDALEANLRRDLGAGFTTIGPHRDDMVIEFKGGEIQTNASRGEIRSVILALKLAELEHIEQSVGASPLLLLDDVFSELDSGRRSHLIQTLGGRQTVITTTAADSLDTDLLPAFSIINTEEAARA